MTPSVSIIIPVYNTEKYLCKCIDSIQSQTFTDWECLLIDDGSKDSSGKICDEYAAQDSRFIVFHKENGGVSSARNKGIDYAKGEWIAFIDSDDYIESTYIEKFMGYDYDLLQGGHTMYGIINRQNHISRHKTIDLTQNIMDLLDFDSSYNINKSRITYPWGKLFKREIIQRNNLYFDINMKLSEDFCFVLNYLCYVKEILEVPNNGYYYNYTGMSSYGMDYKMFDTHLYRFKNCLSNIEIKYHCKLERIWRFNVLVFLSSFMNNLHKIQDYSTYSSELDKIRNCDYGAVAYLLAKVNWKYKLKLKLIFNFPVKYIGYYMFKHGLV